MWDWWEIGCGIGGRWGVGLVGDGMLDWWEMGCGSCERWDVRLVGDRMWDWWEMCNPGGFSCFMYLLGQSLGALPSYRS